MIQDPILEVVYCNNDVKRISYSVTGAEGSVLANIIKEKFPEYYEYVDTDIRNIIGKSEAYRAPYTNEVISLYSFIPLPQQLMRKFGVDEGKYKLKPWFGLKFDVTNNTVILKVQSESTEHFYTLSDIPCEVVFYGFYFTEQKQILNDVDCYIKIPHEKPTQQAKIQELINYCNNNGLTFPVSEQGLRDSMFMMSFVYDHSTLQKKMVKGYRHPNVPSWVKRNWAKRNGDLNVAPT